MSEEEYYGMPANLRAFEIRGLVQTGEHSDIFDKAATSANVIAGLDFVFDKSAEFNDDDPEGQYKFQIKRFGGAFGVTPDHDVNKGFQDTDGIEDPAGEFYLVLDVSKSANGAYHLGTKIDQVPHMVMQAPDMDPTGMDMGAPADPANIFRVASALAGKR